MNAGVQNMAISLGAMQLARRLPLEDPEVINYVRVGYVAIQLVVLSVYYLISLKIKKKNDLTVLKYVEPAAAMSGEQGKLVNTTVRDYDLTETSKLLRGVYMGCAMMAFMHLYMKYTQPLFIQSLMGLKNLYDAKLVHIHLFGKPAVGDYQRPFAQASMFGAAGAPATDAASIAEAEKRVGGKEE